MQVVRSKRYLLLSSQSGICGLFCLLREILDLVGLSDDNVLEDPEVLVDFIQVVEFNLVGVGLDVPLA